MSRFIVRDGLIAEYRESVNGGVAMAQLGVEPERMTKVFKRWTGWLKERPETVDYLARPTGFAREGGASEAAINNGVVAKDDSEHREIADDLSAYSLRRERQDRDHHAATGPTA